jgi:hypothetical protein
VDVTASASVQASAFSNPSPSLSLGTAVSASTQTASYSIPTPQIKTSQTTTVTVSESAFSTPQPALLCGTTIQAAVKTGNFSTPPPSVSTTRNPTVSASVQVFNSSIPAPEIGVEEIYPYNSFYENVLDGQVDLTGDTIKVMLVDGYTWDKSHQYASDITGEISGTGYTAGGQALGSKAVTTDTTDDEGVFDATDLEWTKSTFTASGAVLYKDTGAATASPLIYFYDLGGDKTPNAQTFRISWGSEGIINFN